MEDRRWGTGREAPTFHQPTRERLSERYSGSILRPIYSRFRRPRNGAVPGRLWLGFSKILALPEWV